MNIAAHRGSRSNAAEATPRCRTDASRVVAMIAAAIAFSEAGSAAAGNDAGLFDLGVSINTVLDTDKSVQRFLADLNSTTRGSVLMACRRYEGHRVSASMRTLQFCDRAMISPAARAFASANPWFVLEDDAPGTRPPRAR